MPVIISDDDYAEWQVLQSNALFQQRLASVKSMPSLEQDIDLPIRKLVALFALLGCDPIWSCCGFDYDGQPMHKSHEYGDAFVAFTNNARAEQVIEKLKELGVVIDLTGGTDQWETWKVESTNRIFLRTDFDFFHRKIQYPWSNKSCIHYPELAVIKIDMLERALINNFQDEFLDEVTLQDTNELQKLRLHNWQYPSLAPWKIKAGR